MIDSPMTILLIGGGGREHALAWAIAKSPHCAKLYCSPGNAGIAEIAECVSAADMPDAVDWARRHAVDFVVVGPEAPLVDGLADRMRAADIPVFGPGADGARLEGSKGFMKDLCASAGIPTAAYARFDDAAAAKAYIRAQGAPIVVKADGLAAGKGVVIAKTIAEADAAVDAAMQDRRFGEAGAELVIEGFLDGEECSLFALVSGRQVLAFGSAQDHKAAFDGDTGPNTGGMGAYAPAPVLTPALEQAAMARIIKPTVDALADAGIDYRGVLFAGLMIIDGPNGKEPMLLEHNVRFGDPECQVLMRRLEDDLVALLHAVATGTLTDTPVRFADAAALCVVMAARGYPGSYAKGTVIDGLDTAGGEEGVTIFHAGTARDETGRLIATGGRVLGITAAAATVADAQSKAYRAVDRIDWPDGFCRRDIGWRAVTAKD